MKILSLVLLILCGSRRISVIFHEACSNVEIASACNGQPAHEGLCQVSARVHVCQKRCIKLICNQQATCFWFDYIHAQ